MGLFKKKLSAVEWDSHFPPEFDADFYRRNYSDLSAMDDEQACSHFEQYGREEGRQASPVSLRHQFVKFLPTEAKALEIGPGADPVLKGQNVSYFDVHDTEGMRGWAEGVGKNPESIPEITFTSPQGDLSVVTETFEFVFSSHCVEHQPDLIGHLNSVYKLLSPNGLYAFIIPDGRYCFDALRPSTSIGDVISAHIEGHRRHTLANRIDHTMLNTHNDAGDHWNGQHGTPSGTIQTIMDEIAAWQADDQAYVDTHAWQFIPAKLREILRWSHEAGFLKLKPLRVYDTPRGQFEFMVVLQA